MPLGSAIKHGFSRLAPWALIVSGPARPHAKTALTFDDGPHPDNTPRILDTLDTHRVTASFFLQGNLAEKYPALVREIDKRGHQIGNHGFSHLDAKAVPAELYINDTLRAQKTLEDILGHQIARQFRPPFGSVAPHSFIGLIRQGFCFVFWSFDSQDSYLRDSVELTGYVKTAQINPGAIILLHEDYQHTTEALSAIISDLKRRGLSCTSVSRLVDRG